MDFVIIFLLYFHCKMVTTMSGARRAASISAVPWLIRDDPELHSDISCIEGGSKLVTQMTLRGLNQTKLTAGSRNL